MSLPAKLHLSTVTPVYHGEAYLRELVRAFQELRETLAEQGCPLTLTEAIFVDDGSIDNSAALLAELQSEHPWVKVIQLSKNFGQHPATVAGILHSCGDWVATLDEDLQHPPKYLLPLLSNAVSNRRDVVYGIAADAAVHESYLRDTLSRTYKALLSRLLGNPHVRLFSSFRMLRGSIARAAAAACTHETYFDVALCWFTTQIGAAPFPLKDRRYISERRSGYNLRGLLNHARRMLVSSEVKLLRLGALIGFAALVASAGMTVFTLVAKIFFPEKIPVPGWTMLIIWVLFFGGLTSFLLGIALEYMSIMLRQTQGKPTFLVIDRSKDQVVLTWLERCRANDPADRS